ncbi:FAD-dependent monooxygenase [Mesorhizobium sp. A556]
MDDTVARRIVIAGAGIGGLTAALAFARRGYCVQMFEQAARLEAAGAGIQLSPNATHILDRLGVLERLRPFAVQPQAVILKDAASLRTLATVPLGTSAQARWKSPYLVTHRGDLQKALVDQVAEIPEIRLATGARVEGVTCHSRGITASVAAGSKTQEIGGVLMVGADGVWSTMRGLVGTQIASKFTGELAWRATMAADTPSGAAFAQITSPNCVTTFLHPGFHLVAYPMRGGAAFNLVAFTKGERIAEGWSGSPNLSILDKALHGIAPALARIAHDAGPWTAWPVHTVGPGNDWTSPDGIALIGDAAHAMTPFAAQGAAMAVEDGATLAAYVEGHRENLPEALAAWEKSRKARIARVARRGALNHLAWHAAGPVALARNLLLKMRAPQKLAADLDWLYGWRAPEPTDPMSSRTEK